MKFWMNQSPDFIENKLAPTFIEHPNPLVKSALVIFFLVFILPIKDWIVLNLNQPFDQFKIN
ncbi:hypothetical protein BpHYR1_022220 [Brachionus plicatilis]|uniref:Uncharacterized protein n=1 Tax=Brachionus plicatilis TaxID=10195 RepID=A0A3M7Q7P9_BRAPC|nr:hypothetical protein BpHYR1_022220 [Brachionus plicatilis]